MKILNYYAGITVLSLFDGMSCGQIALNRLGIKIKSYYASEIKPHAIKVTKHNYPDTVHIGDVTKVSYKNGVLYTEYGNHECGRIDLLLGGSPCKGISRLNKKQQGLKHSESILFYEYLRIFNEIKRENDELKFILENTHGNTNAIQTITHSLNVPKISINSRLVSAQNRPRYYWTNLNRTLPEDMCITTNDVFNYSGNITPECRVKWIKSDSGISSIRKGYTRINPYPKSGCITANGYKKWNCNYLLKDGVYFDLSINEIEALQTVDIGYCNILSYGEAYDVLGDGWTIDVICHILKGLTTYPKIKQLTIF